MTWKILLLRFGWKLHMSQVNRSHGWESSTNTIKEKLHTTRYNETLQVRWLLWPPRTLSKPQCLLIYWADLYDSPLDSEASNCILSPPSDATLLYIFPLLSQLYTLPLTMHGYWPLPPIIGCYWGVSSQSQKHLRLAMATIRLETTSNFARSTNTFNTTHMGRKGYTHSCLFFYICFIRTHLFQAVGKVSQSLVI